jgi:hypothetical protein
MHNNIALLHTWWYDSFIEICCRETSREGTIQENWRRWQKTFNVYLKGRGYEGMNCIHLAQDRAHSRDPDNTTVYLRVP